MLPFGLCTHRFDDGVEICGCCAVECVKISHVENTALIKNSLWNMVSSTETIPPEAEAERHTKFLKRRDRAWL